MPTPDSGGSDVGQLTTRAFRSGVIAGVISSTSFAALALRFMTQGDAMGLLLLAGVILPLAGVFAVTLTSSHG